MTRQHYILGTLKAPRGLLRHVRGEPDVAPYGRYDPAIDDFVPTVEEGAWIMAGDTMLTRIEPDEVERVASILRIRNRGSEALALPD